MGSARGSVVTTLGEKPKRQHQFDRVGASELMLSG
jgi:hypothetical protein